MKIPAIPQKFHYLLLPQKEIAASGKNTPEPTSIEPYKVYYPCKIRFGIANAGKLKALFAYDLPCMYSGIDMIDPKKVQKMLKNKVFDGKISDVMERLKPFEKSLQRIELYVYRILLHEAEKRPNKTLQETVKDISPYYKKQLRSKQAPIFQEIIAYAKDLPEGYRYNFVQFMHETRNKLADKPVEIPFSRHEFKYRLEKVKEDIAKNKNIKADKVMNKLTLEAEKLTPQDKVLSDEEKLEIVNFMEIILKSSILKDNEQIKKLLENAKGRLRHEKILVPFSRKSFIYDLSKILEDLPDENLKNKLLSTAEKLPTSRESTAAYILKFSTEPSDKIAYRLLWPSFASVEHLFPKSCGGADSMANFGGACTRENSDRQSIPFTEQLKRRPKTPEYCQKYVDRLIELEKAGIFQKNNVDKSYIEKFKATIRRLSKGTVILDTSKLYEE